MSVSLIVAVQAAHFAPIMAHEMTADEAVESRGLDLEDEPHAAVDDLPRFSYLENTSEAEEELDFNEGVRQDEKYAAEAEEEVNEEFGLKELGIAFIEADAAAEVTADAELDTDAENEMQADEDADADAGEAYDAEAETETVAEAEESFVEVTSYQDDSPNDDLVIIAPGDDLLPPGEVPSTPPPVVTDPPKPPAPEEPEAPAPPAPTKPSGPINQTVAVDGTVNTTGCSVKDKNNVVIPAEEAIHKLKRNGTFVESFAPVMAPVPTPESGRPMPPVPPSHTELAEIKPIARPAPEPWKIEEHWDIPGAEAVALTKFEFNRGALDRAAYWENPGQWKYFLASQIALALKIDKRRIEIVAVDPISFIATVRFRQYFASDAARGDVAPNAEFLAKTFANMVYAKQMAAWSLLTAIDTNKPISIDISQVRVKSPLAHLTAQLRIGANVTALAEDPTPFANQLIGELHNVTGADTAQIQLVSLKPWIGVSVTEVVAEVKFVGKNSTLADEEVNPMTAIMRVKRALESHNGVAVRNYPILRRADPTYPIQRDWSKGGGAPEPWFNDTSSYRVPRYIATPQFTSRPIILPTLLVGTPVNQTYSKYGLIPKIKA
jgi:hypothetical protein